MGRTEGRGGEGSTTGLNMAGWKLEGRVTLCVEVGGGQQADYLY